MSRQQYGGSFAPPLDDAKLATYADLAESADPPVKDAMLTLLRMASAWWSLPESTQAGRPHSATPRATIVPLEPAHIAQLWELVPWQDELDTFGKRFEGIDPARQKPLRNAAFHLLWLGVELCQDREPITSDKL